MEEERYYKILVKRFTERTATEEELEIFIRLLGEGKLDEYLAEAFERDADLVLEAEDTASVRSNNRRLWPRIAVAASVLFLLSAGGYFLFRSHPLTPQPEISGENIRPGSNGAVLTLANGKKVELEHIKAGAIAAGLEKTNDSLLTYTGNEPPGLNTLETPRGRQYAVLLPDGTKVWLNAASKLTYPTRFEKERVVELEGEAFFEVVHQAKFPFRVKTANQVTEDIGTSFNINAYADEKYVVTTLIEGAVAVNHKALKPGQASFVDGNKKIELKTVDISGAPAWKNGLFSYTRAPVDEVLRQFARWYDMEVVYPDGVPEGSITGSVYRNVNAAQALEILKFLDVHYQITGKKITVTR